MVKARDKKIRRGLGKFKDKKQKVERKLNSWLHKHYRKKRYAIFGLAIFILLLIYFFKDASFILRSTAAAAFLIFFYIIDHFFDIRFKAYHYVFIVIIAVAALLLSPLFFLNPHYDKVQHFFFPVFISSIVFHMIKKLDLELKWKLIFTFFIVIGILGLFEMAEYTLDYFFDWKLQGAYIRGLETLNIVMEPLDDTMVDLFLGVLGTTVYGIFVVIYFRFVKRTLYLKR